MTSRLGDARIFRFLLGVALACSAGLCPAGELTNRCEGRRDKDGACDLYGVSMLQLVANVEAFHGKKVRVIGYMNIAFEGNALYLHAEDYEHGLTKNGLWLEVPRDWFATSTCKNRSYVLLEGTVNAQNTGHMGLWSGSLDNVTRCMDWR